MGRALARLGSGTYSPGSSIASGGGKGCRRLLLYGGVVSVTALLLFVLDGVIPSTREQPRQQLSTTLSQQQLLQQRCWQSVSAGHWQPQLHHCEPESMAPANSEAIVAHCKPLTLLWPNGTVAVQGGPVQRWHWDSRSREQEELPCAWQHVSSIGAKEALGRGWVAIVGDSEARKFTVALLNHLAPTLPVSFSRYALFLGASSSTLLYTLHVQEPCIGEA